MPTPEQIRRSVDRDEISHGLRALLATTQETCEKRLNDYRESVARTLMSAGISLIPNDHLLDHQFIVSRGVYEAAKRIGGVNTREVKPNG